MQYKGELFIMFMTLIFLILLVDQKHKYEHFEANINTNTQNEDGCVQSSVCGFVNGKKQPCPPKVCEDTCMCKR